MMPKELKRFALNDCRGINSHAVIKGQSERKAREKWKNETFVELLNC